MKAAQKHLVSAHKSLKRAHSHARNKLSKEEILDAIECVEWAWKAITNDYKAKTPQTIHPRSTNRRQVEHLHSN